MGRGGMESSARAPAPVPSRICMTWAMAFSSRLPACPPARRGRSKAPRRACHQREHRAGQQRTCPPTTRRGGQRPQELERRLRSHRPLGSGRGRASGCPRRSTDSAVRPMSPRPKAAKASRIRVSLGCTILLLHEPRGARPKRPAPTAWTSMSSANQTEQAAQIAQESSWVMRVSVPR
jgi:hypothetical protein